MQSSLYFSLSVLTDIIAADFNAYAKLRNVDPFNEFEQLFITMSKEFLINDRTTSTNDDRDEFLYCRF